MKDETSPSDEVMEKIVEQILTDLPPREDVQLGSAVLALVWLEKDKPRVEHEDHHDVGTTVEVSTWGQIDGKQATYIVAKALQPYAEGEADLFEGDGDGD